MSFIQLNTYAKINLSLDITGVRKDGYHEVSMVMQAVDLSDVISLEPLRPAEFFSLRTVRTCRMMRGMPLIVQPG